MSPTKVEHGNARVHKAAYGMTLTDHIIPDGLNTFYSNPFLNIKTRFSLIGLIRPLSKSYQVEFFKRYLQQILIGPFLNIFSQIPQLTSRSKPSQ